MIISNLINYQILKIACARNLRSFLAQCVKITVSPAPLLQCSLQMWHFQDFSIDQRASFERLAHGEHKLPPARSARMPVRTSARSCQNWCGSQGVESLAWRPFSFERLCKRRHQTNHWLEAVIGIRISGLGKVDRDGNVIGQAVSGQIDHSRPHAIGPAKT
jgi:hypothetical protein